MLKDLDRVTKHLQKYFNYVGERADIATVMYSERDLNPYIRTDDEEYRSYSKEDKAIIKKYWALGKKIERWSNKAEKLFLLTIDSARSIERLLKKPNRMLFKDIVLDVMVPLIVRTMKHSYFYYTKYVMKASSEAMRWLGFEWVDKKGWYWDGEEAFPNYTGDLAAVRRAAILEGWSE